MPVVRKQSTVAERTQALTLHAGGHTYQEIEALTGIKCSTFKALLRRAKERGYVVGNAIPQHFVKNAVKSSRPRVIRPLEADVILKVVTKDFASRCSTAAEIAELAAEQLKEIPGANIPSRRSILR